HPIIAFGVIALYTAAALVALMLAFGRNAGADVLQLGSRELWALGASAFFGIALGHVLYYTSIDRLGVATTAGVLQLQPFVVSGISLAMYSIFTTGVLLWLVYAIALGSWPMIFSNCITAPVALAILAMKLRYRNAPSKLP
ncbi:MAG: hypothetical protein EBU07_18235, partial [Betaproteobacteria bacterium]|nr:hypothetical protein [Betaproteobacteria bacterium]